MNAIYSHTETPFQIQGDVLYLFCCKWCFFGSKIRCGLESRILTSTPLTAGNARKLFSTLLPISQCAFTSSCTREWRNLREAERKRWNIPIARLQLFTFDINQVLMRGSGTVFPQHCQIHWLTFDLQEWNIDCQELGCFTP